jgi:hypothetical protein
VLAAGTSHAQLTSIFSNSTDVSNFGGATTTQVDPVPNPLSGTGWGVLGSSNLDGDAIVMFDGDGDRAVLEYVAPSTYTTGVQFSFDGSIQSAGGTNILWRIGPGSGNPASLGDSVAELRLRESGGGLFRARVDGTQTFNDVVVGLDTRFSVDVLLNPSATTINYSIGGNNGTLDSQKFVVFVNDTQLGGIYDFQNTFSDIGRSFIASGTSAANSSPTFQIDNYTVTAVPEPSIFAVAAGIIGLGIVVTRRYRK